LLSVTAGRLAELREAAADEESLAALVGAPLSRPDLEALAYLRSPAVHAARERLAGARTSYRQSADLAKKLHGGRSFRLGCAGWSTEGDIPGIWTA